MLGQHMWQEAGADVAVSAFGGEKGGAHVTVHSEGRMLGQHLWQESEAHVAVSAFGGERNGHM